jgi:hypothetical protein
VSGTVYHRNLTPADVHIVYAYLYADETSRTLADGFTSSDVGKLARVVSPDDTLYMLISHSPPTWTKVGGAIEPATDTKLGGVMIQSTGGLYIDTVGNLSINSEFLNKLNNLPTDIVTSLANINPNNGSVGTDQIGFDGHSTTNLTISAKPLGIALKEVINKISQNSSDIYNLQTGGMMLATTTTVGAVKVPISGGITIDASANISLRSDFLNQLNTLGNDLAGKVDEDLLLLNEYGSKMVGYSGHGVSTVDPFWINPMPVENALDSIIDQINVLKTGQTAGIPYASATQLGGIKIGTGLSIDPISGVCSVTGGTGGASSFIDLTDTPANYSNAAHFLFRVNTNANGIELVDPADIGIGTGGGTTTGEDHNFVVKVYVADYESQTANDYTVTDPSNSGSWTLSAGNNNVTVKCPKSAIPYNWSAVISNTDGSDKKFLVPDSNVYMRIESADTITFVGIGQKRTFTIYMHYWFDDVVASELTGVYTISVNSVTGNDVDYPTEISNATVSGNQLLITHNQGKNPYAFALYYSESGQFKSYPPSYFWGNLAIVDSNTCAITGVDALGTPLSTTINTFRLNLMFI